MDIRINDKVEWMPSQSQAKRGCKPCVGRIVKVYKTKVHVMADRSVCAFTTKIGQVRVVQDCDTFMHSDG